MCYVGKNNFSKKLRTAKKDIKVIKFANVKNGVAVPYFYKSSGIIYQEGRVYNSKLVGIGRTNVVIEDGLHSYRKSLVRIRPSSVNGAIYVLPLLIPFGLSGIFSSCEDAPLVRMECHIPIGAHYFCNLKGEVVSDKLVVDKITRVNVKNRKKHR